MTTINPHTTRANGTILTAAIYNTDHNNHVANANALNVSKMEGATPPVVDGQSVVWNGTSGASLRTGGFFASADTRIIGTVAGSGLLGGGNLTTDRALSVDFATQAEAEAGTDVTKVMSALRVAQRQAILAANQAEAEGAVENTKTMTSLRVAQQRSIFSASQAEAEAGTENTKTLTSLRVAQAIAALAQAINIGSITAGFTAGFDTGMDDVKGGAFLIAITGGGPILGVSCDGGTNYTAVPGTTAGTCIMYIRNSVVATVVISAAGVPTLGRITPTTGAGNVFLRVTATGNASALRVM